MQERPTLDTTRLVLRPFTMADAPDVQRLAGAREVASTTLRIPHPYTTGTAEAWISTHQDAYERGESANFAIVRRLDQGLIGCIGLHIDPHHAHAEMGYWIGVPFWSHGYCTEAAQAVIQYGFEVLRLHRIHASYMARNPVSGRVMQKIGMTYEGCLRQHIQKWGVFEDIVVYGILRSEYAGPRCTGRT